jgi:hypothetical protein
MQNYTANANMMNPGVYQYFNASIEAQEYASGGNARYQRAFIVVLLGVFIINLLALVYFATHSDWYVDISEPSNLFSLAINSPPSKELVGSCGGGPNGKQYRSMWKMRQENGHVYMESKGHSSDGRSSNRRRRKRLSEGYVFRMVSLKITASRLDS